MQSDVEKVLFFFQPGPARRGTTTNFIFLTRPWKESSSRPLHARTRLRTHAIATETEIDFLVGFTPQPAMGFEVAGVSIDQEIVQLSSNNLTPSKDIKCARTLLIDYSHKHYHRTTCNRI